MKIKNVITDYKHYTILCYVLLILGIILSHYFIPKTSKTRLFIITAILTFSIPLLNIILSKILVKYDNKIFLLITISSLNIKYEKFIEKKTLNKFVQYVRKFGIIVLILIPIFTSSYYYHSILSNAPNQYLILLTTSMFMTLNYTDLVRKQLYNEKPVNTTYAFWGSISLNIILILPHGSDLINYILNYILHNLQNSLTILIAIIMLCVGLSALSFGYCSILEETSDIRKNMKKNGEGFFIASIFSMIAISLSFITSILKPHVNFMTLANLNIFSFDFILLNIYSVLLILVLSLTVYAIYYMIKSSIYSLKELNAFEKIS